MLFHFDHLRYFDVDISLNRKTPVCDDGEYTRRTFT